MRVDSTRKNTTPKRLRSYLTSTALAAVMLGNPAFAQGTPRVGGNMIVHINRDIGGFDHIKVPQGGMGRFQVLWAVHERFFEKDENGAFVPALATEANSSEDFKTWQITLREGVLFSNGEPLTSETCTHHFERLLGSDLADNFRDVIIDIALNNSAALADQSFPEGSPWHCDGIAYPEYDPERAMALLAEIDGPIPPLELWTYNIPSWQQATEIVQAMWAEVGVEAEIKVGGRGPTGVVFQIQSGLTPTWLDVRGSLTHPTVVQHELSLRTRRQFLEARERGHRRGY